MVVSEFLSANGYAVKVAVETKSRSGVFGRDFISGGLIDYFSQTGEGFWLVAKCGLTTSNAGTLLRDAVYSRLGSYPFTMPETSASHLIIGLWEGPPNISEEELMAYIGAWVGRSQVLRQTKRLQGDVQTGRASLKEREQALRRELKDWKENKSLGERWTERYIAGAIGRVEKELNAVEWLLARTDDPSAKDSLAQEAIRMPIAKLVELMERQEHLTAPELEALRKISECQEVHRDVLGLLSSQGYLEHLEDSHLHQERWRLSLEGKVTLELLRGHTPQPPDVTQAERSVLVAVDQGIEEVGSYPRDQKVVFDVLVAKGFLQRTGIFKKQYHLTTKGKEQLAS